MTLLNIYIAQCVCLFVCVCKRAFTAPWGMEIECVELFWNFLTFEGAFDETLKFLKTEKM